MKLEHVEDFNDVVGLTEYRRDDDGNYPLRLKAKAEEWSMSSLGYVPRLVIPLKERRVYLWFRDHHDAILFKIAFAQHYMPAAIHFLPFSD